VKIGTEEVRNPNQAGSVTSPTALREQQNCEICHKKNRGEAMLLCDGCDCGEFRSKIISSSASDDFQDFIRSALIHLLNQYRRSNGSAILVSIAVATSVLTKVKNTACQVSKPGTTNSENCGSKPIRHPNLISPPKVVTSLKIGLAMSLCQNVTLKENSGVWCNRPSRP